MENYDSWFVVLIVNKSLKSNVTCDEGQKHCQTYEISNQVEFHQSVAANTLVNPEIVIHYSVV